MIRNIDLSECGYMDFERGMVAVDDCYKGVGKFGVESNKAKGTVEVFESLDLFY